jgi:serine 3-dehydrogenase (NADP+)
VGTLDGQVALVFGASSGIGRATARALGEAGATVAVAARRASELAELAAELGTAGYQALALPTDVGHRDQVDRAVAATVTRFRRIDVMVNAAGINTRRRRLSDLGQSEWEQVIATNLSGAFHTTQAVVPAMRERGGGLIIQISSISGRFGDLSGAAYQASKHGVIGLCQATMIEEREHGIRVSAIMPGLVETPILQNRATPPSREVLDKALQPEDIAAGCVFLASLPPRCYVPELMMLPPALQVLGQTVS